LAVILKPLSVVITLLLAIGRALGCVAIALMVVAILVQVFFRYGLNNALPWPDEAARFCMLWMTGLMAPSAFRSGGFVAIDMVIFMLPRIAAGILSLLLLSLSLLVLIVAVRIGFSEVTGFGGKFATASLYLPTSLDFTTWYRLPRSWMMAGLFVGVCLLTLVNIELILKTLDAVISGKDIRENDPLSIEGAS
jgi:TRAP-type C4-dicarboxylate transport system permease small subunit